MLTGGRRGDVSVFGAETIGRFTAPSQTSDRFGRIVTQVCEAFLPPTSDAP